MGRTWRNTVGWLVNIGTGIISFTPITDYNCPLDEILRGARQMRKGNISQAVTEYLSKLHAKHSPSFNGAALLASAANLAGVGGVKR